VLVVTVVTLAYYRHGACGAAPIVLLTYAGRLLHVAPL
jgi:hypothetical protein